MMKTLGGALFFGLFTLASGCATPSQSTPKIEVAPGLKQRLLWMDRVRLHDEGRQENMLSQGQRDPRIRFVDDDGEEIPAEEIDQAERAGEDDGLIAPPPEKTKAKPTEK